MPASATKPFPVQHEEQIVRMTVKDYLHLAESGALLESAPIELLDGILLWKDRRDHEGSIMVVGKRHAQAVTRMLRLLDRLTTGHGCVAVSQQPFQLSETSLPEPDIMLVAEDESKLFDDFPRPAQIPLIIEVSDSSLVHDQNDKCTQYAAGGIPQYWIVNLVDDVIEVFTDLEGELARYKSHAVYAAGDSLSLHLPDGSTVTFDVAQVLPSRSA